MHVSLPMIGRHLAQNALAAIAVALEFGIAAPIIVSSLASFQGVKRRLEVTGDFHGVPIISDYGHHPTEVRATIAGIKEAWSTELRQLHVVFQPHRYSRTRDCFADFLSAFAQADTLLMTEIYAAGEKPIDGISAATLSQAMPSPGTRAICTLDEAPSLLASRVGPGDVILCLGAGSIGAFAERLPALLLASELQSEAPEAVPT